MAEPLTRLDQYWTRDESGNLVMPELQSQYLDWLLDDDREGNDIDWAKAHDVSRETVKKWKQDNRFKEAWDKRATARNIDPQRLQKVIDVLYKNAVQMQDLGAAKQFLAYAEKLMPPKEIKRDNSVAHLTDDELISEMRGLLAEGL